MVVRCRRDTSHVDCGCVSESSALRLAEVVRSYPLPVKLTCDKMRKWCFRVGQKPSSNLKLGGVQLRTVYDEHFLLGMAINDGKLRAACYSGTSAVSSL